MSTLTATMWATKWGHWHWLSCKSVAWNLGQQFSTRYLRPSGVPPAGFRGSPLPGPLWGVAASVLWGLDESQGGGGPTSPGPTASILWVALRAGRWERLRIAAVQVSGALGLPTAEPRPLHPGPLGVQAGEPGQSSPVQRLKTPDLGYLTCLYC